MSGFYLKRNTGLKWVKEQFLKTSHDSRKPSEKTFHLLITVMYSLNDDNTVIMTESELTPYQQNNIITKT